MGNISAKAEAHGANNAGAVVINVSLIGQLRYVVTVVYSIFSQL